MRAIRTVQMRSLTIVPAESLRRSGSPRLFEGRSCAYHAATRSVLRYARASEVNDITATLQRLSLQSSAAPTWTVDVLIGVPC